MSENQRNHPPQSEAAGTPESVPGATGIFGVLPTQPAANAEPASPRPAAWPAEPSRTSLPELPPRPIAPSVVVHEVKFQAQDESDAESKSSLERLLQSLPYPGTPAPPQAAGEFTQLLSVLHVPDAVPPAPSPESPPLARLEELPTGQVRQEPTSSADPSAHPAEPSSFTRLFEALAPSESMSPPASPSLVLPAPTSTVSSAAAPFTPPAAPPDAGRRPAPVTGWDVGSQEPQRLTAAGDPQTSFTQLFAALDRNPSPELNQAADYPPLGRTVPGGQTPPASALPPFQPVGSQAARPPAGQWTASSPQPPQAMEDGELNSLTQLLRALDGIPAAGAAPEPLLPAREAAGGPSSSGATVAFTPPESVQRMIAKTPPAPSGPGDFTRVLQASALRESGLGSQAVAGSHPPEPQAPSRPPVSAAGAPLPPWGSPPMPHLPHMPPHLAQPVPPHLSQVNSHVPGLGPVPGLHVHGPAAFVAAPSPAQLEGGKGEGKLRSRGQLLPLILIAIIVILVIALVAVLLQR